MIATWRRLAGVLVGTGFRAARWTATACLIMSVLAAVASVTYSIGYRVMIDGATANDGGRIALGAALVAGLFTLSWLLALVSGTEGSVLTDKTSLALGVRIARITATLPTLEHFERHELLARIEQLTQNRRTLAGAPRQLISLTGQGARALGHRRAAGDDLPARAGRAAARARPRAFGSRCRRGPAARRRRARLRSPPAR